MKGLAVGFALALGLVLALTPLVRRVALHIGALDPFSARKAVRPPTVPRLGGVGIALSFYAAIVLLWLAGSALARQAIFEEVPVRLILLGGVPILILGIVDDLRGLPARTKLLVQAAVGALLWLGGLRVLSASSPLGAVELPAALSAVVTVAWLIGVTNAVNLIDGLDGLASGVALFALGTATVAAAARGDLLSALLTGTLAGAVLGFLRFNWAPATILMGDAGSLFLGYLLAATSIWSVRKAATAVLVVFPVVALGLPLLDTSLTISRRLLSGRPVMQADRDHVHHRALGRMLGVERAVLVLYGACAVFALLSLGMVLGGPLLARGSMLGALGFALLLSWWLGYLRGGPNGLLFALRRRRRTRALLQKLDQLTLALESSLAPLRSGPGLRPEVEADITRFAAALGMPLRLVFDGGAPPVPQPGCTAYPIGAEAAVYGYLIAERAEADIDPDERTLLQLLCDTLGAHCRRGESAPGPG